MPSLLCGLMSHQVVLSHFVHLNGISPKWILSWVSNLKLRSSCTLFAIEWLLSCVGSLMFLQVASYWEALVALWAFKRLLSFVGPLMLLQVASYWEALVVLSHFEHLKGLSPVWILMLKRIVTLCLPEWNLSSVGPLMFLQVASYWEALVALLAFKRLVSCVGPPCAERCPCHTYCTLMAFLPCGFPHVPSSCQLLRSLGHFLII